MAEINFFMTDKDGIEFIQFLIETFSAEFVPERSPHPPPFPRYRDIAQIRQHVGRDAYGSRFFVLSSRWERYPLLFDEIKPKSRRPFFVVSQRHGGPAFDLILSRTVVEKGRRWILSGSFADYAYYMPDKAYLTDPAQHKTFARPATMAHAFRAVQKYIRANGCRSRCSEDGRAGPWVLDGAASDFYAGTWLRVGEWHFEPKGK